jgi:hypothetical protein
MPEFSTSAQPIRPGSYWDFNAVMPQPVYVNTEGIVALSFTHNYGPANTVVTLNSMADFLSFYGVGLTLPAATVGYKAASMCFQGEGMPGRTGASQVLAYRMVNATGASSSASLQNTTPAAALTLTAMYPGTFGSNITYTVIVDATNPTTQLDLCIFVSGAQVETWVFNKADTAGLAAMVNAGSHWVTAVSLITGTAVAPISTPTALSAGNDGATLVSLDYTNMMAAFAVQRFGVFATADLEDVSIMASLNTWQAGLNAAGQRFETAVGGPAGDTALTAASRSVIFSDPNVVNIGVGTYTDAVLGTLDTAQLAPRLAGIIAARGDKQGLTYSRLAGLTAITGAQNTDILAGISSGFMTIGRDSNALSPLRIEKGVTTFITTTNPSMPFWCYSNPKFVLTMQQIENDLKQWANDNVIGQLPVDQNSVDFVIGYLKNYLKGLESNQVIQLGSTVIRNPSPPPTPQDNFIAVLYGVTFMRDMEQILNTVTVQ